MNKQSTFYLPSTELRAQTNADGSKSIVGLIAYNKPSQGLPWTETIAPGAFADALKPDADVLLLRDHKQENLLARSLSKTLQLEDTPVGLKFTASLSTNNSVSADTLDSISRGDLSGVSFGFTTTKDAWSDNGQNVTRSLLSVALHEISVTSFAVYPSAQVSLRSVPAEYRSLLSDLDPDNDGDDDECTCETDEDGNKLDKDCHCDDENDADQWAERSRMRLKIEEMRSYSEYIRS